MAFTNNIMIVRHKLFELSPRKSKHLGRCCVHKKRAVWKYKSFPLLGLDMTDENGESY